MTLRYIFIGCLLALSVVAVRAQDHSCDGHDHSHSHSHGHSLSEIGVSGGALYGPDDKEWGGGLHVHYLRRMGLHSRFSVGGFAEWARIESDHFSVGAGIKYEPVDRLGIGVYPGITMAKHHSADEVQLLSNKWESNFSFHVELVYDLFHWSNFHLGPALDYSWMKHDQHIMIGVHAAYCF